MTAARRRLVLWDVDGTLVTNGDSDETLFVQAVQSVVPPRADVVHPHRHGKTDLQQVTEYLVGNGGVADQVPLVSRRLVELSHAHFATAGERTVLAGVSRTLQMLAADGHVNALLTGNGRERAALKLFSAGLDPTAFDWESSFFGESSDSRSDLTLAARAHAAGRSLVPVVIGDTVGDATAAEAAGIEFIGVATGAYRTGDLLSTLHALVVENLEVGGPAVVEYLARPV